MYNMSKIKIKKIALQYSYLILEKEEVQETGEKVENEITSYMKDNYPERFKKLQEHKTRNTDGVKNPNHNPEEIEEETDSENEEPKIENKELKKIYRKIATKTHPDKTDDEEYCKIFSQAAEAYADEDMAQMIHLSGLCGIELTSLSDDAFILVEKNIKSLTIEILKMKDTIGWKWSQCRTNEEKDELIKSVFESRGI